MKGGYLAVLLLGATALSACATTQNDDMLAPAPPMGPGAIMGSVAADRDGDGIVDGYYTGDGVYRPFEAPACPPPPPPPPTPRGERG